MSIRVPAVPKVIQLESAQALRANQSSEVDKPAGSFIFMLFFCKDNVSVSVDLFPYWQMCLN